MDIDKYGYSDDVRPDEPGISLLDIGHGDRIVVTKSGEPQKITIGKVSPIFTNSDEGRDPYVAVATGRAWLNRKNEFVGLKPLDELTDGNYEGRV